MVAYALSARREADGASGPVRRRRAVSRILPAAPSSRGFPAAFRDALRRLPGDGGARLSPAEPRAAASEAHAAPCADVPVRLLTALAASAQRIELTDPATLPRFEVVSVKPGNPDLPPGRVDGAPGRFVIEPASGVRS